MDNQLKNDLWSAVFRTTLFLFRYTYFVWLHYLLWEHLNFFGTFELIT